MPEIIRHPYEPFLPEYATLLLIGSFPPLSLVENLATGPKDLPFYYGSSRNQMWRIFEQLFQTSLLFNRADGTRDKDRSLAAIQKTLREHNIAVCDIIKSCRRSRADSGDQHLMLIEAWNIPAFLRERPSIRKLFFTGGKAEELSLRSFPELINFPHQRLISSSPRAIGGLDKKTELYRRSGLTGVKWE